MPVARPTVNTVAQEALAETGLYYNGTSFAGTDMQSRMVANAFHWVARDCLRRGLITHEHTFYTTSGTDSYQLPSDFYLPIQQTTWNRTDAWVMTPINVRQWQREKSGLVVAGIHQQYRIKVAQGGHALRRLYIDPTPTARERIAFEYKTSHWLEDDTTDAVDDVTLASDTEVQITAAAHGMAAGDVVYLYDLGGSTELNHRAYTLSAVDTNTFDLLGTDGDDVTAYTSGGTFMQMYDKVTDADSINWFPSIPEELLIAGLEFRLLKASGMAYFDERNDYESVRDTWIGSYTEPSTVNMGTGRQSHIGIPESDFPSS